MALPTHGLSLCAGIGGLDLGLELAIPGYRTVVYVEREAYAASTLVARMEDSSLAPAPIWDDLASFDGRPWRGVVDLVSAGFPCQPFSAAGKRAGTADDRWIWPHIARILGEVRPRYVFLENVRGFLAPSQRDAFGTVLGTLADLGMSAAWGVFRASDVGAPHRRERWFLLAYRPELPDPGRERTEGLQCGRRRHPQGHTAPNLGAVCGALADAGSERCARVREQEREQHEGPQGDQPVRSRDHWLQQQWPPRPDVGADCWPADAPQPAVRRGADGIPDRVDRLRCLGNAVVPQQAALAFATLAQRLLHS